MLNEGLKSPSLAQPHLRDKVKASRFMLDRKGKLQGQRKTKCKFCGIQTCAHLAHIFTDWAQIDLKGWRLVMYNWDETRYVRKPNTHSWACQHKVFFKAKTVVRVKLPALQFLIILLAWVGTCTWWTAAIHATYDLSQKQNDCTRLLVCNLCWFPLQNCALIWYVATSMFQCCASVVCQQTGLHTFAHSVRSKRRMFQNLMLIQ